MAKLVVALALVLLAGTGAVSPVQKVIEILEEYKGKVAADLAAEEKEMAEYAEFCDSESSEKGYTIKTATTKIAALNAAIQDAESTIQDYESEVATMGTQMAEKENQLGEATAARGAENKAFQKNEAELITSIDELENAVNEIKQATAPKSFVQVRGTTRRTAVPKVDLKTALMALSRIVDASWVNSAARQQIQGLMQTGTEEGDSDLELAAPKAAAFEASSGGIVGTMEEMQEKAETALTDARQTETKQAHSHDMIAQSLTNAITTTKEKIADAKTATETERQELGQAQGELTETTKEKNADEAYLASLTADCAEAREAWANRQGEAKAEMEALNKAKEILSERVKVFVQVGGHTAAARGDGDEDDRETRTRQAVLRKLKELSKQFHSFALMEMVTAVAADPFEKVRGLIESMIAKLVEEANQEATQKAFCDEEIGKSKASQAEKNMNLDKLKSRIDTAATKKAELENAIKEQEGEIADLDRATSEATKIRTEEKATFDKSSSDFKQAADAVESAIQVLKEYYEGASLVQTRSRQPTFGGKKSDAASTILSILEMCGEDFTKTYMELQQEEALAVATYKKLMAESATSKASKLAEVKGMQSEINSLNVALKDHDEDFATTSTELDAVLSYLDKLKPQCESKAMSYEEKKARREAELDGLKEALSILSGDVPAAASLAQVRSLRHRSA